MNAQQAAEAIQSRFKKDDDDQVVACTTMQMSDILGSDWASGRGFDCTTPVAVFYRAVCEAAERRYGLLPF
jgi:hypothetical protein